MTERLPAPPQRRKLVTQSIGALDKRTRRSGLTRKVRTAVDAIIFDRCTREEACKRAGFTERALYLALAKVEVASYWRAQIDVLRTGERARNVHRLAELRDQDENRNAAVAAIKAMERLEDEAMSRPAGGQQHVPGIVIQIIGGAPERPVIDVTPERASIPSDHQSDAPDD